MKYIVKSLYNNLDSYLISVTFTAPQLKLVKLGICDSHEQLSEVCILLFQIGIIGGSGMSDPKILLNVTEKTVTTPFGKVKSF